jgi:hypothetical protein
MGIISIPLGRRALGMVFALLLSAETLFLIRTTTLFRTEDLRSFIISEVEQDWFRLSQSRPITRLPLEIRASVQIDIHMPTILSPKQTDDTDTLSPCFKNVTC